MFGKEACDDGAASGDSWSQKRHCNATCTGWAPYCGDGVVTSASETCDDGDTDDCTSACAADCRGPGFFCTGSDMVALYRFESSSLGTDSRGANPLLDGGGSPIASSAKLVEGGSSLRLYPGDGRDWLFIPDSNLSADFPLKAGTANRDFTMCVWIWAEGYAANGGDIRTVVAKKDSLTSFLFALDVLTLDISTGVQRHSIAFELGDGAGGGEMLVHAYDLGGLPWAGWVHVCASYEDTHKSYAIRLKDVAGNRLGTDKTGFSAAHISVGGFPFVVGCFRGDQCDWTNFGGYMDELIVFRRALTEAECTSVAKGLFR